MNSNIIIKPWGHYKVLNKTATTLTKELVIKPGGCLSYQKHKRAELWFIAEGKLNIIINDSPVVLNKHNCIIIPPNHWHTAYIELSEGNKPATIIETWFSNDGLLDENDIERKPLPKFCPLHSGYNGI